MATDSTDDLQAFYRFLGEQLETGRSDLSPEKSLEAFRAHQRDLERLEKEIGPAVERFRQGEGRELEWDALEAEVVDRLAEEGISD